MPLEMDCHCEENNCAVFRSDVMLCINAEKVGLRGEHCDCIVVAGDEIILFELKTLNNPLKGDRKVEQFVRSIWGKMSNCAEFITEVLKGGGFWRRSQSAKQRIKYVVVLGGAGADEDLRSLLREHRLDVEWCRMGRVSAGGIHGAV